MIYAEKDLCGKKDFLEIIKPESPQIVSYEIDGIEEIVGENIGTSNNIICSINPINFEYQSGSNSCPTSWIRLQNDSNHLFSLADGIVVEYEIIGLNKKSMTLKMVREIENFGIELHERIEFRRIESKN